MDRCLHDGAIFTTWGYAQRVRCVHKRALGDSRAASTKADWHHIAETVMGKRKVLSIQVIEEEQKSSSPNPAYCSDSLALSGSAFQEASSSEEHICPRPSRSIEWNALGAHLQAPRG